MSGTKVKLEIAHVLFIDIVGYSKLLIDDQHELQQQLNEIVRRTQQFRAAEAAGKLLRLPTGDGMALVFFTNPEAPVQCALEIGEAVQRHPQLRLRMGINTGPVSGVADVNDRSNLAGAGINMAQRVMEIGDAGHILLSKRAAEDLLQYRQWKPHLHDLGEVEVKHGAKISIVNLYTGKVGNPKLPEKQKQFSRKQVANRLLRRTLITALLLLAGVLFVVFFRRAPPPSSSSSTLAIPEKSIAVLPFQNLSDEKANAFFADGVHDEILTDLAKVADLKVISRTSVMQYKDAATRNLREIAQQLGVAHVLEGTVQRAGGKVRVSAQLIDARTDAHEWAEKYDRPIGDVFTIQSEIAKTIADQLRAQISPREKAAMSQAATTNLAANQLYVQAKELEASGSLDPNGKQKLLEAARLLDEAVTLDPRFLGAYCLLSEVHLFLYFEGFDHTPARRELANTAIQNASQLQPDAGDVHLALARYAYRGFRDYDRARAQLDLARSTLPNNPEIYLLTGFIDRRQGRWTEAVHNFDRAVELDPRNLQLLQFAAHTYQGLRRYSDSSRLCERALNISPGYYVARLLLAENLFVERADLRQPRVLLSGILAEERGAAEKMFSYALAERDRVAVTRALATFPPEGVRDPSDFLMPREWYEGLAARTFGDAATAKAAFTAAAAIVGEMVRDQPDYAAAWSALGLIHGNIERKEEAVSEGRRACELLPLSLDAWRAPILITNLAMIYVWIGDKDKAIEQLVIAAQVPNGVHYGELKLDPQWDPLRADPRFEKIAASLAPKN
jgi:TolB-like protein/class 3 adenylate cyclase/Tfp pilus assembly protein PilF